MANMTHEMLERENNRMAENLALKANRLKGIALDLEQDSRDSNAFLEGMGTDFSSARSLLGGTTKRLNGLFQRAKHDRRLACYLITGIVGSFLFVYYVILHFVGTGN